MLITSLLHPYHTVSADTIHHILDSAITLAGLGGQGFNANCFRPTGTTYAGGLGYDLELVMIIKCWKTYCIIHHMLDSFVYYPCSCYSILKITKPVKKKKNPLNSSLYVYSTLCGSIVDGDTPHMV